MLVLSRKEGQKIHIGDGVVVTINQIKGNRVRVGIQAPEEISIRRTEIIPITNPTESPYDSAVGFG